MLDLIFILLPLHAMCHSNRGALLPKLVCRVANASRSAVSQIVWRLADYLNEQVVNALTFNASSSWH